jgi:tetratricopeptide (TPR) repeat protein
VKYFARLVQHHFFEAGLAAALLLSLVYLPGLHGPFLFDDFANLPSLGAEGRVDNAASFARYITSGNADPTGRPLAVLSFLIDANDWPADPFDFKRTNLLLHMLNGMLLAILLRRLGTALAPTTIQTQKNWRIDFAALLGAALWLLHPLFVSTTMYVVQREAMIPAMTTLAGLLLWTFARKQFIAGNTSNATLLVIGFGAATALGVMAKANGALLPTFMLVMEYVIFRCDTETRRTRGHHLAIVIAGWIPTFCVVAYLVMAGINAHVHGTGPRPWSIGERLLTEPRVLWTYLRLLWLPRPYSPGVFNDQVVISTSLFHPASTSVAIAALAALAAIALGCRNRFPAVAAAIVFFLVGHLIESTTIPLELYYEHRNYVPALLMFWPLGQWLAGDWQRKDAASASDATRRTQWLKPMIAGILVLLLASLTFSNATLWGNEKEQGMVWARINPGSMRAQANAAQAEVQQGNPEAAIRRLRPLLLAQPDQVQIAFNLLGAECALGTANTSTLADAAHALQVTRDPGTLLSSWFTRAIDSATRGECANLNMMALKTLVSSGLRNPYLPSGRQQDLVHMQGMIALQQGNVAAALTYFNQALLLQIRPAVALEQAATLGAYGHPREGLEHLAVFESVKTRVEKPGFGMPAVHAWVLGRQHYWENESAQLSATLVADLAKKNQQVLH